MTRPTVKYLLLLALAITLFYWKTLLTNQYTTMLGAEGVNLTYAWLHFWVNSIRQGHLPLWDPYVFAGRPFAGEMQPMAWYPPQLLFALVPMNRNGLISTRFYHEYLALTHLLCAYFMFALLRELQRSRFAAFVAACAFSLGGLLVRMMWPMYVASCIWLPALFLFLLRALRTERRGPALVQASLAGLCLGMSILTGGMTFTMMQGIFAVTAIIYYCVRSRHVADADSRSNWQRPTLILVTALAVAAGTGAIQLLPAREYSQLTIRFITGGTFPAAEKIPYDRLVPGLWPQSLLTGLFPAAFGGIFGGDEAFPYYIGVFPLLLAILAIWKCWGHIWVRYLTVMAVLAFVYSLGEFSFLHGVIYAVVPLMWASRSANRFLYLVSFALAVLSAYGLDTLIEHTNENWWAPARRVLKWAALACTAAFLVPAIFPQLSLTVWSALSLLLIAASCVWFAWLTRHPASPSMRVALAAFILFDLSTFNWVQVDQATVDKVGDQMQQMISLRGPCAFIKSRPGLNRVRVGVQPEPNVGDVYGVQSIWGGGATALTVYSRLGLRDNLLNVGYYIKPASAADPNPIYKDRRWKVFENRSAFPRAWLTHETVVEPSVNAVFRALDNPAIDLHTTALMEAPLPRPLEKTAGGSESVRFRSYEPDRMAMDVDTPAPALVVLSEMYYPGWRARVNGKPAEIYRVDGALRGIIAPGGTALIELEYAPGSFRAGAIITVLTLLCVLAGSILAW